MILLLTNDLFFVPIIRSAAEKLNSSVLTARNLHDKKLTEEVRDDVQCCIVDLSSISLADLPVIFEGTSQMPNCHAKIAFGSHVHKVRLDTASEVGFSPVLTKGQLCEHALRYLSQWLEIQVT
ncbi:MAG: hypothetical protein AB8B50_14470 [Pirellulaceae bacterium]